MPVTTRLQTKLLSGSTSDHLISSSINISLCSPTISLPLGNKLQCASLSPLSDLVPSSIHVPTSNDHCGCYGSSFDDSTTTLFH
jgi:hypothetical protein